MGRSQFSGRLPRIFANGGVGFRVLRFVRRVIALRTGTYDAAGNVFTGIIITLQLVLQ